MADKDTLMEEFVATEAAKAEDAAKDLERVEQQVVAEATMSTEYDDAAGQRAGCRRGCGDCLRVRAG